MKENENSLWLFINPQRRDQFGCSCIKKVGAFRRPIVFMQNYSSGLLWKNQKQIVKILKKTDIHIYARRYIYKACKKRFLLHCIFPPNLITVHCKVKYQTFCPFRAKVQSTGSLRSPCDKFVTEITRINKYKLPLLIIDDKQARICEFLVGYGIEFKNLNMKT